MWATSAATGSSWGGAVKERANKARFDDRGLLVWLTDRMREQGLILRKDERGDPRTQLYLLLPITGEECDRR